MDKKENEQFPRATMLSFLQNTAFIMLISHSLVSLLFSSIPSVFTQACISLKSEGPRPRTSARDTNDPHVDLHIAMIFDGEPPFCKKPFKKIVDDLFRSAID